MSTDTPHDSTATQTPPLDGGVAVARLPAVDIVVIGAGIAGLWTANVLQRRGYSVLVFEKDVVGGVQTLASQGMIHGGQKYTLTGSAGEHASAIAAMPARWQACFDGCGDVDLTGVAFACDHQIMWPAGGIVSSAAVLAAAQLVNAGTRKLARDEFPEVLATRPKFKGPVYRLPEVVMDAKSLTVALAKPLAGRILRGAVAGVLPDGQVAFSHDGRDIAVQAQLVVSTAGLGNEEVLKLLKVGKTLTQRRPLRQIMVRALDEPLFGHGIVGSPKPRLTVTAARDGASGGYVWYLGGALAENAASLDDGAAIELAAKELADVFPHIDWSQKEFATWYGERAEPANPDGQLPAGPTVQQRGRVVIAWPTKLTFAPLLADQVQAVVQRHAIKPYYPLPALDWPQAQAGAPPWEDCQWHRL